MRKIFPEVVYKIMQKNRNVFCLLGDIGVFSFRNVFSKFKDRILNMSTMEQSMIGFGAGLSKAGYIPIIHSITPFLVLRALEQIKIDLVYNKLTCNIVTTGASNDYSKLGTTHHCFEDISVLSNYNNINLFIPSNAAEFEFLLKQNYNNNAVNYYRISENTQKKLIKKNSFIRLNKNNKLVIIVGNAISVDSIKDKNTDIYYINSITKKLNLNFIKNYKKIVIIEPYFGNILERKLRQKKHLTNKILTISYDETIIYKYGSKEEQDKFLNFDEKKILKKIYEFN
jgi:transketolase|tara:strand:- start:1230 stop:2081 length:852 start_codon:yes stop_codon:yes gene_type:complete